MDPHLRLRGSCQLLHAFDVGFEIDLPKAMAKLSVVEPARPDLRKGRLPVADQTGGQALRSSHRCEPVDLGAGRTEAEVAVTLYRFGVLSLSFSAPFDEIR